MHSYNNNSTAVGSARLPNLKPEISLVFMFRKSERFTVFTMKFKVITYSINCGLFDAYLHSRNSTLKPQRAHGT